MDNKLLELEVLKNYDLQKLENDIFNKITQDFDTIKLKLPRDYEHNFFKDNWINTLLNTAAAKTKHLIINNSGNQNNAEIIDRLTNSVIGINMAYMADEINYDNEKNVGFDIHKIMERVAFDDQGMLVDKESNDIAYSFMSFDGKSDDNQFNSPKRPSIISAKSREQFIDLFLDVKRKKIDLSFGISSNTELFKNVFEYNENFAAFIYELFENTNQHGRLGYDNEKLKGVRSFTIKMHRFRTSNINDKSGNFSELASYLNSFETLGKLNFYEISIADNGIGIINRFLASRLDYAQEKDFISLNQLEKLNYIIDKSLSSKFYSDYGKGIKFALGNIQNLQGFATVRTNNLWAYFDGKNANTDFAYSEVSTDKVHPEVRGTFYNILIPFFS